LQLSLGRQPGSFSQLVPPWFFGHGPWFTFAHFGPFLDDFEIPRYFAMAATGG
jgi:hypothetical protein